MDQNRQLRKAHLWSLVAGAATHYSRHNERQRWYDRKIFIVLVLHSKDIQWSPSKADTIGTWFSVRYSEVSAVQMRVPECAHVLS